MRFNEVEMADDRFAIIEMPKKYSFLDSHSTDQWTGPIGEWAVNVSRDDGKSFNIENMWILSGDYFFISDQVVRHSRSVYGIIEVLSDFGGINEIFTLAFVLICTAFNERKFTGKAIRALYFARENEENSERHPKRIKFSFQDMFHDFCFVTCCCC